MDRLHVGFAGPRPRQPAPRLVVASLGLLLALTLACEPPSDYDEAHPPPSFASRGWPDRIVVIVGEDLAPDALSPYGGGVETRALARLAERGQVFEEARAGALAGPALWPALDALGAMLADRGYETLAAVADPSLLPSATPGRHFDAWRGPPVAERAPAMPPLPEATGRTGARLNRSVAGLLADRQRDQYLLVIDYSDARDRNERPDLGTDLDVARYFDRATEQVTDHLQLMGHMDNALVIVAGHPSRSDERAADARIPLVVSPASGRDPAAPIELAAITEIVRERMGLASGDPATGHPGSP